MEIKIDTKEDSPEEIRKAIRLLQHIIGDSAEVFTNQPEATQATASSFNNIFGDASSTSAAQDTANASEPVKEEETETSESTEDLFAELFNEEELQKMKQAEVKDEEEDEIKPKDKKHSIEFY